MLGAGAFGVGRTAVVMGTSFPPRIRNAAWSHHLDRAAERLGYVVVQATGTGSPWRAAWTAASSSCGRYGLPSSPTAPSSSAMSSAE